MTIPMAEARKGRSPLRSVGAVAAGFFAVVVLSVVTDQVLHVLKVYPPWDKPMFDPGLNLLALAYRCVYTVIGGFIAAKLAPSAPRGHATVLGIIGTVIGTVAAVFTITKYDLGPDWYPIALAVTAFPLTWLGGVLATSRRKT